ncbi:MAG: FadR family transcriptional regulator [Proteobacteria bacterium]|nr:MAG: FadR family transcriptional regulator [Pseudomonadota bacterium]
MKIEYGAINKEGMAKQISDAIREAIMEGRLVVDERLPSETELAQRFGVSRPTVREALKRLAAQNLIRTRRGATGGVFVNRVSWSEAHDTLYTTATLLLGMNRIDFQTVAEARLCLEGACLPLACARRSQEHLDSMDEEIALQLSKGISDEEFCASDVRFHRAVVDAAANPVLSFQLVGIVEAMQPLMNMLTYRLRDRTHIAESHRGLANAIKDRDVDSAKERLNELIEYNKELAELRLQQRDDNKRS